MRTAARAPLRVPKTWLAEEHSKVGPFVTRETYRLPRGPPRPGGGRPPRQACGARREGGGGPPRPLGVRAAGGAGLVDRRAVRDRLVPVRARCRPAVCGG